MSGQLHDAATTFIVGFLGGLIVGIFGVFSFTGFPS